MRVIAKKLEKQTFSNNKRIFLVYQAGIANVFAVKCHNLAGYGRKAKRLLQSDFQTCETFVLGMAQRGSIVRTAACNMAGDIIDQHWSEDLENQPFSDKFINLILN